MVNEFGGYYGGDAPGDSASENVTGTEEETEAEPSPRERERSTYSPSESDEGSQPSSDPIGGGGGGTTDPDPIDNESEPEPDTSGGGNPTPTSGRDFEQETEPVSPEPSPEPEPDTSDGGNETPTSGRDFEQETEPVSPEPSPEPEPDTSDGGNPTPTSGRDFEQETEPVSPEPSPEPEPDTSDGGNETPTSGRDFEQETEPVSAPDQTQGITDTSDSGKRNDPDEVNEFGGAYDGSAPGESASKNVENKQTTEEVQQSMGKGLEETGEGFVVDGSQVSESEAERIAEQRIASESEQINPSDVDAEIGPGGEVTVETTRRIDVGDNRYIESGAVVGSAMFPTTQSVAQEIERRATQVNEFGGGYDGDAPGTSASKRTLDSDDVAVVTTDEGFELQLTNEAKRDLAGRQADTQLEQQYSEQLLRAHGVNPPAGTETPQLVDFKPGEDFTVDIEGDSVRVQLSEQRQRQLAETQATQNLSQQTGQAVEAGRDVRVTRTDSGYEAELTEEGQERLSKQQTQSEQFGDIDWSFGMGGPEDEVEQALESASKKWQKTGQNFASALFDEGGVASNAFWDEPMRWAGYDERADRYEEGLRDVGKGVARSGFMITDVPGLAKTGLEAVETTRFAATNPNRGELFPAAVNTALSAGKYAWNNKASSIGLLGGSLVASYGIMRAGSAISPAAGTATRYAIQPGEELAGSLGYRGTKALASTRRADQLFPNKEPLIFSEEADIRGARTASTKIDDAIARSEFLQDNRGQMNLGKFETKQSSEVEIEDEPGAMSPELDSETALEQQQSQRRIEAERNRIRRGEEEKIDIEEAQEPQATVATEGRSPSGPTEGRSYTRSPSTYRSGPRGPQMSAYRAEVETESELMRKRAEQAQARVESELSTEVEQVNSRLRSEAETLRVQPGLRTRARTLEETAVTSDALGRADVATDTEVALDTESQLRTDIMAESRLETMTESKVGVETEVETETRTRLETELESEFETELETELELEGETRKEVELFGGESERGLADAFGVTSQESSETLVRDLINPLTGE